ncbi:hypothetical protein BC940DRAFT_293642 [Gongronella butleri]|nr:hypothetical protein BC940DRAFT_293642 [Gongronella butleri]
MTSENTSTYETKSQQWYDQLSLYYDMDQFPSLHSFQNGEWYWLEPQQERDDVVQGDDVVGARVLMLSAADQQWTMVDDDKEPLGKAVRYADVVKMAAQGQLRPFKSPAAGMISPLPLARSQLNPAQPDHADHHDDDQERDKENVADLRAQYKSLHSRHFNASHAADNAKATASIATRPRAPLHARALDEIHHEQQQTTDQRPLTPNGNKPNNPKHNHYQNRFVQQHKAPSGRRHHR